MSIADSEKTITYAIITSSLLMIARVTQSHKRGLKFLRINILGSQLR